MRKYRGATHVMLAKTSQPHETDAQAYPLSPCSPLRYPQSPEIPSTTTASSKTFLIQGPYRDRDQCNRRRQKCPIIKFDQPQLPVAMQNKDDSNDPKDHTEPLNKEKTLSSTRPG